MLYGSEVILSDTCTIYYVLILIFLENALRLVLHFDYLIITKVGLNPYFFGKCSTAAAYSIHVKDDV